jgi:hypothetical protein
MKFWEELIAYFPFIRPKLCKRPESKSSRLGPPSQWVPGLKRPECEADHSSSTSAEIKKMWIYTFTLPYAFMA